MVLQSPRLSPRLDLFMFSSTPVIGPVILDLWHFTKQESAFQLQTQRTGQRNGQRNGQRTRTGLHTRLPTRRLKLQFTPVATIIKQVSSFSCPILAHASILLCKIMEVNHSE